MYGVFKHKIVINICVKAKQVGVTLWICGTDQNQTENEGKKLSSLQTTNGEQGNTNSYGWFCN